MTKYGMATEKRSISSSDNSEITSSQGTHVSIHNSGTDGSLLPITGHKLNGHNYLQWSQSVLMFVCGKGKDDYLTGVTTAPKKEDSSFKTWKTENNMVMSWLINSMTNEIGETFLLFGTAKEIWDAAREIYSSNENTSELFEIESNLHDLRQGDLSLTQYFNTLSRYWQQLDMFEEYDWKCPEDATKYREIVEKKRVYKFLIGLNKHLDEVRGRILGTKPLPNIR